MARKHLTRRLRSDHALLNVRDPVRVLLIKTSELRESQNPWEYTKSLPMGLMYISSALKQWLGRRVETMIINVEMDLRSYAELSRLLDDFRPHLVGLSTFTSELHPMRQVAAIVTQYDPLIPLIVGGPHPSSVPEMVLHEPEIDIAVQSEGETTVVELLKCLIDGGDLATVKGISYCDPDGALVQTPRREPIMDIDGIPFPDLDAIDIGEYFWGGNGWSFYSPDHPQTLLLTSRGCPFHCIFCGGVYGKRIRMRSPENVLAEMRILSERFGVREFSVIDEVFNFDNARYREILRRFGAEFPGMRLAATLGMRGDLLSDDDVALLADNGGYYFGVSIESASQRIQKLMNKRLDIEKSIRVLKAADRLGMITFCTFMIGFLTETEEEIQATLDLIKEPYIDFPFTSVVIPLPGTKLRDIWLETQLKKDQEAKDFDNYQFVYTEMNLSAVPDERFAALRKSMELTCEQKCVSESVQKKLNHYNVFMVSNAPPPRLKSRKIFGGLDDINEVLHHERDRDAFTPAEERLVTILSSLMRDGKKIGPAQVTEVRKENHSVVLTLDDGVTPLSLMLQPLGTAGDDQALHRAALHEVVVYGSMVLNSSHRAALRVLLPLLDRLELKLAGAVEPSPPGAEGTTTGAGDGE